MRLKSASGFTKLDSYLFHEGTHYGAYCLFGAHPARCGGAAGTRFTVWAPNAKAVSVITEDAWWDENKGAMQLYKGGVWQTFIPGALPGTAYRFVITGADGKKRYKSDPYAFSSELRPANASVICAKSRFRWHDEEYMASIRSASPAEKPMAIYEVHLGSWKKDGSAGRDGFLNYRRLGEELAEYVSYMGYTHVELIGICEYPFDGSWGYQVTGYFAPTSRYGAPDDFRYFVDALHARGIGVILDWVPAHFPKDDFGLTEFDGTALYEPADPLLAEYPEWGTKAFDHGRPEVRSFLISSAFYWIREFHIDALRVDAVAAMLYTSFGRKEWRPNRYGGMENIESMDFLRQLNAAVRQQTGAYLIAEDSSIVPGITDPVEEGGFGFAFKWNMGWMNDTLKYIGKDPIYRQYHHGELTHTFEYAFCENFVLVLSHDEVVHLKHSMLEKFPGTLADKLGGLKALYALQFTHPGKKLLFMGQDFAEDREWDENREINWAFAEDPGHRDVMLSLRSLIALYKRYPALHVDLRDERSFEWIRKDDAGRNIISYVRRRPESYGGALLTVINFSTVEYPEYSCGAPVSGTYRRVFSSCENLEDGDRPVNIRAKKDLCDGRPYRISYPLRPYEAVIFELPGL